MKRSFDRRSSYLSAVSSLALERLHGRLQCDREYSPNRCEELFVPDLEAYLWEIPSFVLVNVLPAAQAIVRTLPSMTSESPARREARELVESIRRKHGYPRQEFLDQLSESQYQEFMQILQIKDEMIASSITTY